MNARYRVQASLVLALLAAPAGGACAPERDAGPAPRAPEATTFASPGDASVVTICGPEEPGRRLAVTGRVLDYDARPLSGAAVIAYHTGEDGLYNPRHSHTRVPRLRGTAVTAGNGTFTFHTIWPGAYPEGGAPAHIHLIVTAPAHHPRFLEIQFEGDPLLTREHREHAERTGNAIIVKPTKGADGAWSFHQDVRLSGS
jgi:protocatechuate 3,4-dioxygenase beta subunit